MFNCTDCVMRTEVSEASRHPLVQKDGGESVSYAAFYVFWPFLTRFTLSTSSPILIRANACYSTGGILHDYRR